jgi:hypothetical protein
MSRGRPKGSGVINKLDPTKQDAVEMRRKLWRGDSAPDYEKLNQLYIRRAELTVQLTNLRTRQAKWCKEIQVCASPTGRAFAKTEFRSVEREVKRIEREIADTNEQIKETNEKIINETPKSGVHEWQARAVALIELYKYLHKKEPGSVVPSTLGATVPTHWLQERLRAEGFKVDKRQLQRFIHDHCRVIGQQGQRTDLTCDNN